MLTRGKIYVQRDKGKITILCPISNVTKKIQFNARHLGTVEIVTGGKNKFHRIPYVATVQYTKFAQASVSNIKILYRALGGKVEIDAWIRGLVILAPELSDKTRAWLKEISEKM